jgi:hypothetical protein
MGRRPERLYLQRQLLRVHRSVEPNVDDRHRSTQWYQVPGRCRLASQLLRRDGGSEPESFELTDVRAWRDIPDAERHIYLVGHTLAGVSNDPPLDFVASEQHYHDDHDDHDGNDSHHVDHHPDDVDDSAKHYDYDDDDNDDAESDASTRVDVLCLGERALRVLRRNGSALRSERHLHQPEDLHRRSGLQQLCLRRPARRYLQVVRNEAYHDDDHYDTYDDDYTDDHHPTSDEECSARQYEVALGHRSGFGRQKRQGIRRELGWCNLVRVCMVSL